MYAKALSARAGRVRLGKRSVAGAWAAIHLPKSRSAPEAQRRAIRRTRSLADRALQAAVTCLLQPRSRAAAEAILTRSRPTPTLEPMRDRAPTHPIPIILLHG
jgi:hypothetical protein